MGLTHKQLILRHLIEHGSITPLEALDIYGVYRLGARICDLRREGHDIRTERETGKNRYGDPICYARYIYHRSGGKDAHG